jgi:hypothetical protein
MDNCVDETLSQLLTQIVADLQATKLEEAEQKCNDGFHFGQTISALAFDQWRKKCVEALKEFLPYQNSTSWVGMGPSLAVKEESASIQLLQSIFRCFSALDARKDAIELLVLIYCLIQPSPERWLQCSELCLAENELLLASRCCGNGIRSIMFESDSTHALTKNEQAILLSLWFQRSRVFELQDRISDSMAAISIFARLSAEFQQMNASNTSNTQHTTSSQPLESAALKKLAEKRQKRLVAI